MDAHAFVSLLTIGAGTGVLAALLGIGGGIVAVPVLTQVYGFSPAVATGTSLCCVFLNCLSGSAVYLRQRRVDVPLALTFAAATLPGVALGIWLVDRVQIATFDVLFGALMAVVGLLMFAKLPRKRDGDAAGAGAAAPSDPPPLLRLGRERALVDSSGRVFAYRVNWPFGVAVSGAVGVIASFFGVGGGLIHVPFLHRVFGMAIHTATATSLFILTFTSLGGAAGQVAAGHVRFDYVLPLGLGLVLGAQIGARQAPKAKPILLASLVAVVLAGVGFRLVWRGLVQ
jgi:uncharacterized membrane protein YfcA